MQQELNFETSSKINADKLRGQNRRLYDWLKSGKSIHVFHPAKRDLQIGYLNSRCSDLINKHGVNIQKKFITVNDIDGHPTTVVEYSL